MLKRYVLLLATVLAVSVSLVETATTLAGTPQTVTFDALTPGPLTGQYPSGVIDWGSGNTWVVSGPWGSFTTNSFSFATSSITSGSFNFVTSARRLISLDAYNGDSAATTITLTCDSRSQQYQTGIAAGQVVTLRPAWTYTCGTVTLKSSNGWNTNFQNVVWDDGTGPLLTGVQASNPSYSGFTVSWTTSSGSNSQVEYGPTAAYGSSSPLNSNLVTAHTVTLSGLAAGTQYHYRVKSADSTGLTVSGDNVYATASTACVPPITNAVQCENSKTGNPPSDWDVGSQTSGDTTIQGFTTDISYNKGDTVTFKVNTPASAYTIDIYRMGYYAGNGARKVATLQRSGLQTQPACLVTVSVGLVDCGNWAASATWVVPTDAVSGIYFAKVMRADTGGASHIYFVVRDDAGTSDVLFKTSDTTWQAYNPWGGASLYVDHQFGTPNGRAVKVSYNRPFITRDNTDGLGRRSFVFYSEYPMVRWLEANGYNVSYFTSVDADRRGALMNNHKLVLSVGHDEYWSGGERTNFETARSNGVNLGFFSGNQIFWKTRWENSIDGTNTTYRTLVTYKETQPGVPIDPQDPPTWTGTWRDPRYSPPGDGGRPENALSGSIFTVNGPRYDTLVVGSNYAKLRFWRNTAIANLTGNQTVSLAPGSLGHEWDEDLDNGFRPAGIVQLSSTTYSVSSYILDFGTVYGAGVATHSLTLYRASSGGLVFGAGMTLWPWGLDGQHDADVTPPAADVNMQQATVNLFADMNAQASSLQPGLVAATASTDHTPPTSTITSPAQGATLSSGQQVTIRGTATDAGGGVVGGVEISTDGGTTWHPTAGSPTAWSYQWTATGLGNINLRTRAVDDSGNLETPSAGVTVTIPPPPCPCSLWSSTATPAVASNNDSSSVEVGVRFKADTSGYVTGLRFYKGTANTGTHVGSLWSSSGTLLAQATFTGETASGWQQVNFATPVAVTANTVYVASYHAPVGSYALTSGYFANTGADNTPLHAPATGAVTGGNGAYAYSSSSTYPSSTYNGDNYWVDVVFNYTATVSLTISNVQATSITSSSATITWTTSAAADSQVDYGTTTSYGSTTPLDSTQVVNHSVSLSNLSASTTYHYRVRSKDASANSATSGDFTFATTAPIACPCTIWPSTATPATASNSDTQSVEVGLRFKSDVNGSITGIRFYKGPSNTGTHVASLWSSTGTLLAQATFTGETASGWQQVNFMSPVAITANTVYVASYHAPAGGYSADLGFFNSSGVDTPPLHAPATGQVSGGNGTYVYSASSTFPTNTYNGTNYWVDVVFKTP